jgi:hypothetical protein
MLCTFSIGQEHVPAFRAALRAGPDSLAAGAADAGEIVFLDTKVFEQDYMTFCDNFAARRWTYSAHARLRMRRRREAIYSYLGRPILHGVLYHAGFVLNVVVDNASGAVIHRESDTRISPERATDEPGVSLSK